MYSEVSLMEINNLDNWANAATIYAEAKGDNIYSCFCKSFADEYFSNVRGLRLLDAGCGDGEYTEMFRLKDADATGCDSSTAVIAAAKSKYPLCTFDVVDLTSVFPYNDNSFDAVFSNLVFMDIDPLEKSIEEISRVMKLGGKLFFSIVHPAFYPGDWGRDKLGKITHKKIMSYISHKPSEVVWATQPVLHYHRPISFYFNLLAQNGFLFSQMYEPEVYEEAKIPDIPLFLFSEFIKG